MKLSVLIPVYKAEKYIERCALSLFNQTLRDLEYIFVDDCSPDKSIEILLRIAEDYPHRKDQVKIVRHEKNMGSAEARWTAIQSATSEYVFACDSDDWIEPTMFEELCRRQEETNADVVICNWKEHYSNDFVIERKHKQCSSIDEWFKNFVPTETYLWDKMIKRALIVDNNIRPKHSMYEDFCVILQVMYYAKSVAYVDKSLYHYNLMNSGSLTQGRMSIDKARGARVNYDLVESFFYERNFDWSAIQYPAKLNVRNFYLKASPMPWDEWRNTFPEIVPILLKDKSRTIVYRWCYYLAHIGFTLPMSMLKFLPSWKLTKVRILDYFK